jgi:hypothetical protein
MGPGMIVQTFDHLTLFGRRWFFRIVDAGNHETLAQSEGYNSSAARDRTAFRFVNALDTVIQQGKRRG